MCNKIHPNKEITVVPFLDAISKDKTFNIELFLTQAEFPFSEEVFHKPKPPIILINSSSTPTPFLGYVSDDLSEPRYTTKAYAGNIIPIWAKHHSSWLSVPDIVVTTIRTFDGVKYLVWTKELAQLARVCLDTYTVIENTINSVLHVDIPQEKHHDILCNIYGGCWARHNVSTNGRSDMDNRYCVKVDCVKEVLYTTALPIVRMQNVLTVDLNSIGYI